MRFYVPQQGEKGKGQVREESREMLGVTSKLR
jgi:hypothetical protein